MARRSPGQPGSHRRTFALLVRYDGGAYKGWQPHPELPTVGGVLSASLHRAGIGATPFGASRTDAGVHARAQVASFSTRAPVDPDRLREALNDDLPGTIRILALREADASFHSHWSSIGKVYRYRLSFAGAPASWRLPSERFPYPSLDTARLAEALRLLEAAPDVSAFATEREHGPDQRKLTRARIVDGSSDREFLLEVAAAGFGKHLVRHLVGGALGFAVGAYSHDDLARMLARQAPRPPRADADGLSLHRVLYPEAVESLPGCGPVGAPGLNAPERRAPQLFPAPRPRPVGESPTSGDLPAKALPAGSGIRGSKMIQPTRLLLVVLLALSAVGCARTAPKAPRVPTVDLQVDPAEPAVPVGEDLQVVAQAVKADGKLAALESAEWAAGQAGIFSINSDKGRAWLTGLKVGETILRVSAEGLTKEVTVKVTGPAIKSLALNPTETTIPLGGTATFSAVATYSDNSTEVVTAKAAWTSSDTAIAPPGTESGTYVGRAEGTVTAKATYQGLDATAKLTVNGAQLLRIEVSPPLLILPLKTSLNLKAVAVYDDASTADVTDQASWTSSQPGIASVTTGASPRGLVTGLAAGDATVTASFNGKSAAASVTVTTAEITSVELTPPSMQLAKGTTGTFQATALFTGGIPPQDVTLFATWSTADSKIASLVSGTPGKVKGEAVGSTKATATFLSKSGSADVKVTAATLSSIAVNPAKQTVPKGSTASFNAVGTYSDGSTQDITTAVTWTSSDGKVASISNVAGSQGQAKALSPGPSTITAKLDGVSGTAALNVTAAEVVTLTVAPDFSAIAKGTTGILAATATFTDLSSLDVTDQADWTSTDNTIASVSTLSSPRGVVAGVKTGQVTITAAFGGKQATATVIVTPATLVSITLDPLDPTIAKGTKLQMHATGKYSDGNTQDVTTLVTWTITDLTIASVSNASGSKGLVTALAAGKTEVKASLSGVSAKTTLTVTPATLEKLLVAPASLTLDYKGQQQLVATAFYSDGTSVVVTDSTDWTSDDPTIASVTSGVATGRGMVTGNRQGKTVVSASFGGLVVKVDVTVNAPKLTKIEVRPATLSVVAGRTGNLTAWATYADNTQVEVTLKATWTVDNGNAKVDATGKVTGLKVGTAKVTATFETLSGFATVTVTDPEVDLLTITPQSSKVSEGNDQVYTVSAVLSDGTSKDVSLLALFTSDDVAGLVSINKNVVTGVHQGGPVTITASYGGKSASAKLTITAPVTVVSITVSPGTFSVAVGAKKALTVTALYSDGTTKDVTATSVFSSADRTIVDMDATSAVGVKVGGPVTITVSYAGKTTTAAATVVAADLVSLAIDPSGLVLQKNQTGTFKCIATYSDGSTKDLTSSCTWSSDNFAVASVVPGGTVTGIGGGTTTIRAKFNNLTGTATVVVQVPTLDRIAIVPPNAVLRPNLIYPYRAWAVYSDQTVVEVPHSETLWTIDNPSVAEMYNFTYFGIWAKDAGLTPLYVNYDGSMGNSRLQVLNSNITGVEVTPGKVILPKGTAAKMSGIFAYKSNGDGWAVEILNPTWASTNDSIVRVGVNGIATAYAVGSAEITCTAMDMSGIFVTNVPVTVTSATITKIDLNLPSTMVVGLATKVHAMGTFSDGTVMDLGPSTVFWSVSDSSLASISPDADGTTTVVAKAAGNLTVSATFGSVTASKNVVLAATTLSSLTMTADQTTLAQGSTSRLTVTGNFADGTQLDLTESATYDSMAPDVVQIATGLFTTMPWPMIIAHAPNQTPSTGKVRATFQGKSVTQDVTVNGANLRSLAVGVNGGAPSSGSVTLTGAGPFQLKVVGTFTDNSTADVTAFCTFEPANSNPGVVATISNSKAGQVTLLGKGTQTLKVTYAPSYIGQPLISQSMTMTVQ
ncbi:MAG: Ig-like domain-containing protein [Myxococcales bacterium]